MKIFPTLSKRSSGADPYASLKIRPHLYYLLSRFLMTVGIQLLFTIINYQLYAHSKDPLVLGFIGLSEAIPAIGVALFAGHMADYFNRKLISIISLAVVVVCTGLIYIISLDFDQIVSLYGYLPVYLSIMIIGFGRGFVAPALFGLRAQLVPPNLYTNSSVWNSTVWQMGAILGPVLAGLIYGYGGIFRAYEVAAVFILLAIIAIGLIKIAKTEKRPRTESLKESLASGVRFVFNNQVILHAISLDLFAVLFGGAVALLPFFADEILMVGPKGYGILRAAPGMGALAMALVMVYFPPNKDAGKKLLLCVGGFGLCMILFAFSKIFILSLLLLALSGMLDNVSVVVRSTILQTFTPDHMRGRVSSVNSIFIGSSNEIGEMESGIVARLMGVIPSVVFGGCMTLLVTGLTAWKAPKLRQLDLRDQE